MFVEEVHGIPYIFVSLYQCYARDTTQFVHAPERYARVREENNARKFDYAK